MSRLPVAANSGNEGALQKRNGEGAINTPLTILHLTAPGPVGGLERVVAALAAGQRNLGHRVHVATVLGPGESTSHPLVAELRAAGVTVEPIEVAGRAYLRERAAIAALCRRIAPNIAHTHGYRTDVIHSGVARRLGIPLVSTVHGFTGGGLEESFLRAAARARLPEIRRRHRGVEAPGGASRGPWRSAHPGALCPQRLGTGGGAFGP